MLKLENNQYVRELVNRKDEEEVKSYNDYQNELGSLDNIFARNAGADIPTPERWITYLTPEVERREAIEKQIFDSLSNPNIDFENLRYYNTSYETEELEKFYDYYVRKLANNGGIVVSEEKINDPRISWGTDTMLDEVREFEDFVEKNANTLPGLPEEIKLLPGDTVGISAPTGSGKTTSLIGITIKHLNAGKRVLFIALEETEIETRARIIRGLDDEKLHRNLGFVSAEDFKESTFRTEFTSLLTNASADVVLIDYINDAFLNFDVNGKNLQGYEKIKKTVSVISDINHKEVKTIVVIGVQGTAKLLTAKKHEILSTGKAFFEGGQSTIKPLQYAILIQDADPKEDGGEYEKLAYVVKQRNILVKSKSKAMGLPTYGMTYNKDQYTYNLIGDLKVIVKAMKSGGEKAETKPSTAKPSTNGGRR